MTKPKRVRAQSTRQYPRTLRVNELVREIAAEEIERYDDERLELIAITSVEVDPDLRHAVVWFDTRMGEAHDDEALEALNEARIAIQAAIARQARMKRTPTLTFRPDTGIRTGERVDEILREHPAPVEQDDA
ncbi:MAG TPA: 30S ribosome-binding factor RbfA [Acidimicrobiales bacterium]|nr:30S ribosome-binding factor RbfA [Acidimicrobiales bacterium]